MKDKIPSLIYFTKCYWNQMGHDLYSSVENAFSEMLADASRTPDRGAGLMASLRKELMYVYDNPEYATWLEDLRQSPDSVSEIGGAVILPEKIPILLQRLDADSLPG